MNAPLQMGEIHVRTPILLTPEMSALVVLDYGPERIPAERCYVIYWAGVLEIPWPEGMTAEQAVAAWKRDLVHLAQPRPGEEIR